MDYLSRATIPFDSDSSEQLMMEWTWLIGEDKRLVLVSVIGDVFVTDKHEKIFWLDTGVGKLEQVAESRHDFFEKLEDHDQVGDWLMMDLVDELLASGKLLGVGQVYSYIMSPIIGGEYAVHNFIPLDLEAHLDFTGQFHRQISTLPNGTRVRIKFENKS
ncbi:hypothetical protein GCM10023091_16320 [Ravibacter arvi]|uniref:T6SS immunity protein Tdi1 C-terminal domain-containing protein n=1 Tax=Ravibacter arvi TaxID=2051041 RepID=A0ABP8LVU1_9BACT